MQSEWAPFLLLHPTFKWEILISSHVRTALTAFLPWLVALPYQYRVLPGAWLSVSVSVLFKLYLCVGCKAFHKSHTCAGEDGNCRTHISDPLFSTCKSVTVPQKECCFRCSYLGEITAEHTCHTAIASSFLFIPHAGQKGEKKQQK